MSVVLVTVGRCDTRRSRHCARAVPRRPANTARCRRRSSTIPDIAGFHSELNKQVDLISSRIGIINESLVGIDYNEGRYIRPEESPTPNQEIRAFRDELRQCSDGSFGADDTEHENYTDSGDKSGGQKEKLAYTIVAASLAYQFNLKWGVKRSKDFRFVVIDEAFGRGLQRLIVTPLQNIHAIAPFVPSVGYVENRQGNSSQLQ